MIGRSGAGLPGSHSVSRRLRRTDRGQSHAEFSIVVPIFLILVFGIVDFSMALRAWLTVTNASREGARVLVLGQSCSQVTAQSQNVAKGLSPSVTVTITPSTCTGVSGDSMSVSVSYTYKFVTPLGSLAKMITGPITMTSTSTMRHE